MSKEAMRVAVEALSLMYANSTGTTDDEISARLRARAALSLLRAELEAGGEAVACIHKDTLAMLKSRRVDSVIDPAAVWPTAKAKWDDKYVMLYASPVAADTQETDKRLLWLGQVRDDFRLMAEEANRYLTQHCQAVTQQAEGLK